MADEPWARLAELVRRRRERCHLSQRDVAIAAGTTDRLVSSIERAERTTYKQQTLRAIAAALGWHPDSIRLILAGKDPVVVEPEREAVPSDFDPVDFEERLAQLEADMAQVMAELGIGRQPRRPPAEELAEYVRASGRPSATDAAGHPRRSAGPEGSARPKPA